MIDEYSVRAEVARIEALETTSRRKASMLLGLTERMRPAMLRLADLGDHHEWIGDPEGAAQAHDAGRRMRAARDDARSRAATLLFVRTPPFPRATPFQRVSPGCEAPSRSKEVAR